MIKPFIPKKQPDFQPSKDWETALQTAKKSWIAAQVETNPWFKQDKYVLFQADLIHFHRIHRTQSPIWAQLYYPALKKWEQEAAEMLKTLQQNNLGTVRNPYQTGLALTLQDEKIFLGRQKLRDTLQMHLLNAPQLPLFLIHGQRRVGKTSLLNFLQTLLGEYYMVVQQDLQGSTDCMSVEHWLTRLRQQIDEALQLPPAEWQATEDWLTSWEQLRQHLGRVTANQPQKLIIALDEYEGLHEKGFKHHPEKAGHLLGALRSFAQSQRAVVFLFIGAHYFFELQNPDWSHYFVHAQYLEVDYLTQSDSIQLVTQPYPQFPIRYAAELPQTIFEATNGHPALIQEICYALVLVANHQNRVDLTVADLQNVLNTVILVAHNNVIGRFWRGFCADWGVQETVLRIVQGETVAPKAVKELLLHQYIVPIAGGKYRMRVPLFEEWVLKFGLY
jgi:hypothetical protein